MQNTYIYICICLVIDVLVTRANPQPKAKAYYKDVKASYTCSVMFCISNLCIILPCHRYYKAKAKTKAYIGLCDTYNRL